MALTLGFLTLFLVAPSLTIYIPPQSPQRLQPPQSSDNDVSFLFNLMNVLDPSTVGLSLLANPSKMYTAVPHCYNRHLDTFSNLKDRVYSQPTKCFPNSMDKLVTAMSDTFTKSMKAYVTFTDFMDNYNTKKNKDILALLQFVTEEKQLAMEIMEGLNYILDSSNGLMALPNCFKDDANDVYGEYQGKLGDALYCLHDHITDN